MPSLEYLNKPEFPTNTPCSSCLRAGDVWIRGVCNPRTPDVRKFLGIKYASIPQRFRTAVPLSLEAFHGILEADRYGPRCPQPIDLPREQRNHLYAGVEPSSKTPVDEFECLTLNIYAPNHILNDQSQKAKLPVLVWIHGGGWTMGDGNSEFDGSYLVQHSLELGVNKPFIFVSINYRVGFYGFLASKELRAEAESHGEERWNNQGLHDQHLALLWIQKHISRFGGNPNRVTLSGESAGAWCVMAHLQSDVSLFQRAFVMSCPMGGTASLEDAQAKFDKLVQRAGCTDYNSTEEKLKALRTLSYDDLEDALGKQFVRPVEEPLLFGGDGKFSILTNDHAFPPWIEAIIIGTTKEECALWMYDDSAMKSNDVRDLTAAVHRAVPNAEMAQHVIDEYGLSNPDLSYGISPIAQKLASDALFSPVPFLVAGNTSSMPVSIYSFRQKDIYPTSIFKGFSYHSLDNVFFARLPAVTDPALGATKETRANADAFNHAIIELVEGDLPWPLYNTKDVSTSKGVFVFEGTRSQFEVGSEHFTNHTPAKWARFMESKQRGTMFNAVGQQIFGLCRLI